MQRNRRLLDRAKPAFVSFAQRRGRCIREHGARRHRVSRQRLVHRRVVRDRRQLEQDERFVARHDNSPNSISGRAKVNGPASSSGFRTFRVTLCMIGGLIGPAHRALRMADVGFSGVPVTLDVGL